MVLQMRNIEFLDAGEDVIILVDGYMSASDDIDELGFEGGELLQLGEGWGLDAWRLEQ